MKISVVVPDGIMVVDGVARAIDMSGLDSDVRVIQFQDTAGHIEHFSTLRTTRIQSFAPYQFLMPRWVTAGIVPPQPPQTDDEKIANVFSNPVLHAMIMELASRVGITSEAQLIAAIKARLP